MSQITKPELLMPAGDLEKAQIAYQFGADACYGSTSAFSMRTREIGFNYQTLKEAIDYAHSIGKKFYVTLNTYPHEFELPKIKTHARRLIAMNPDAIIVADPGILQIVLKEIQRHKKQDTNNTQNTKIKQIKKTSGLSIQQFNNIEIHLSTQANATNSEAIKFWASRGVSRIILPRELSLGEIAKIRKVVPKKIVLEAFVHGAMCNSISGRCNLSNYLVGRDANRGACVQACRWKYALVEEKRPGQYIPVKEDENGSYIYNSRDLCMIEHLDELAKAGVNSFKVEGRNKSIYYAAIVARAYRRAIDIQAVIPAKAGIQSNRVQIPPIRRAGKSGMTTELLCRELSTITNRGYSTGFYFGKPTDADIDYETSRPASDWQFVGIVKEKAFVPVIAKRQISRLLGTGSAISTNQKIAAPSTKRMARNDNAYIIECRNEILPGTTVEIVTPTEIYECKLTNFIAPDGSPIKKPNPNTLFVLDFRYGLPENSMLRAKID